VHRWSLLIVVQRHATQSSLFIILQVHSTCFGCQYVKSKNTHSRAKIVTNRYVSVTPWQLLVFAHITLQYWIYFFCRLGKQIFSRPLSPSVSLLLRFVYNWLQFLGTAKHLEEKRRQILVNKIVTGFLRKKNGWNTVPGNIPPHVRPC